MTKNKNLTLFLLIISIGLLVASLIPFSIKFIYIVLLLSIIFTTINIINQINTKEKIGLIATFASLLALVDSLGFLIYILYV